jgi:hypothetical protein
VIHAFGDGNHLCNSIRRYALAFMQLWAYRDTLYASASSIFSVVLLANFHFSIYLTNLSSIWYTKLNKTNGISKCQGDTEDEVGGPSD